jgi:aminopeptidase
MLSGVDTDRIIRFSKVSRQNTKEHAARTMSNELRWSVLALPSLKWAAKVFPDISQDEAMDKLMDAILKGARADGADPIKDWKEHRKNFVGRLEYLNQNQFKSLRFTNSLGTDITLGLPENHEWAGGGDVGQDKVPFFPNIPTEEIFTAPHRNKADGKVVASMPLSYQGNLIEDFSITFKDGRAVEYSARTCEEILKSIIEMDEGSHYLGEVALVANSSPISQMGILFYNTLFDENASCHLALGKAYPDCVEGGSAMTEEELLKAGINDSLTHVDFMFGTADMKVVATAKDGSEVVIMENGELLF